MTEKNGRVRVRNIRLRSINIPITGWKRPKDDEDYSDEWPLDRNAHGDAKADA